MGLTRLRAEQISDIDYKQAVRVISVANVTLSGGAPNQVDSVNLTIGDRVLVNGQSTGSQNGIYEVDVVGTGSNGTWIRSTDTNATGELQAGTIVMVTEGTVYKDTQWKLTTNNPIIIGTTALTFEQNSAFAFGNVYADGTAVLANTVGDVLTLTAGNNIQITGNNTAKSVTIAVTGISLNSISNGTSNVNVVSSGGNVTVGVGGTANVATFTTAGLVANSVAATNNGAGTNFKVGDDTWLGDINVADTLSIRGQQNAANAYIVFGNASNAQLGRAGSGPLTYGGAFSATGNITGSNLSTAGLIVATGNITGGNILTGGLISATGNVTGGNLSIVADALISGNLSVAGNATLSGNILGDRIINGNTSIEIQTASGNANVSVGGTSNVAVFTTAGLNISGVISASGNIQGSNLLTAGLISATSTITSAANIAGGNILTVGQISATGNVTGNFFIGNGAFLTGLSAGSSNGIANGATSISIPVASGNITMGVTGQANTVVINLGSLTMYGTFAGPKALSANVSVANAVNAVIFGPVTINDGFNITVPDASILYTYSGT
jgi:hypothetical protein